MLSEIRYNVEKQGSLRYRKELFYVMLKRFEMGVETRYKR